MTYCLAIRVGPGVRIEEDSHCYQRVRDVWQHGFEAMFGSLEAFPRGGEPAA